jgi:hypothetical protein
MDTGMSQRCLDEGYSSSRLNYKLVLSHSKYFAFSVYKQGPVPLPLLDASLLTPIWRCCSPPHTIQVASQQRPCTFIPLTAFSSLGKKKTCQKEIYIPLCFILHVIAQRKYILYLVIIHHRQQYISCWNLWLKNIKVISCDRPWMSLQSLNHTSPVLTNALTLFLRIFISPTSQSANWTLKILKWWLETCETHVTISEAGFLRWQHNLMQVLCSLMSVISPRYNDHIMHITWNTNINCTKMQHPIIGILTTLIQNKANFVVPRNTCLHYSSIVFHTPSPENFSSHLIDILCVPEMGTHRSYSSHLF